MTATNCSLPQKETSLAITQPLVTVRDLSVLRGGRVVVTGAGFSLPAGEIIQLVGSNGAGKTSVLRALAGLAVATGEVTGAAKRCALMPPDDALWHGSERVERALAFWARLAGRPSVAVQAALLATGLSDKADARLETLSAGQKRSLSWARVQVQAAPLWLLDEPFNSLDAAATARMQALLAAHVVAGGGAVLASPVVMKLPGNITSQTLHVGPLSKEVL